MKKLFALLPGFALLFGFAGLVPPGAGLAGEACDEKRFGAAGILSKKNRENLPALTLSAGMALLQGGKLELKSGRYYELEIKADGSQELALQAPGFFRAIWIDEIVIEGIEIRPFGIDSLEFDEAGTAEISFLAIKPGRYVLQVPGSDLQKVDIIIR